jgi:peroxiredoxin
MRRFNWALWSGLLLSVVAFLQERLPDFQRLGVKPVAISVDAPAVSAELARKAGYTFPILSDRDAAVIRRYDLLHKGAGGGDVARPAEFLVDRNGVVRWRNLSEDYRVRARVEEMLAEARKLSGGR